MKQRSVEFSKMKASLAPKNVALLSMIFLMVCTGAVVVDSAEAAVRLSIRFLPSSP